MQVAPIPDDELERLSALKELGVLDTPAERRFDMITETATKIFQVPISTLTLVDTDREWYKSCKGVTDSEKPRQISFCGHALLARDDVFVVPDTKLDPRFVDNPMVVGEPFIRFYAGVPLYSLDDRSVGVFCIKGTSPRTLNEDEISLLKTFASWAELELNAIGLGKILNSSKDLAKIQPLVERMMRRDVLGNLKAIKLALKFVQGGYSLEAERALDQIEGLAVRLKTLHYICTGGCKGISDHPGECHTEGCPMKGHELAPCDCIDSKHFRKWEAI